MKHHCGIVAIYDSDYKNNIYDDIKKSMQNIQHRGYDGTGICYYTRNNIITVKKEPCLVTDFFNKYISTKNNTNTDTEYLDIGNICIGHIRYSTRASKSPDDLQPFIGYFNNIQFSLAHNGNIYTMESIQKKHDMYVDRDSDTYLLVKLIEKLNYTYDRIEDALIYIINTVPGSYSLCILYNNYIYTLRDRFGIRPLYVGKNNSRYKIASETVCLEGYNNIREIKNGEIVRISDKLESIYHREGNLMFCSFELIYFMNHKSNYNDISVYEYRYNLGKLLGSQEKDILINSVVSAIPNSSIPSAKGFSYSSNTPYCKLLTRSKLINRTFILKHEEERITACNNKFNYNINKIKGKHIYLLDDSIVRGTTTKVVVRRLKEYGAKSVHVRIVSPPISDPCYFGINMSTKKELIKNNNSIHDINNIIGSDSLKYISIDDMLSILGRNMCTSCFTGKYEPKLIDW